MKAINLGRHPIRIEVFVDGVMNRFYTEHRVVKQQADGTFEIRWMDSQHRITKTPSGEFAYQVTVKY